MTRPVPYPADTRAKGWRFELDHERIEQSDTWALTPAEIRPWLLMLWLTAWRQTPCGALPADDELIAAKIGMPVKAFAKAKAKLMRGWWLAEDGRLYHDTLILRVTEMMGKRRSDSDRQAKRRAEAAANHAGVTRDTGVIPAGVGPESNTGTGTSTGTIGKEIPPALEPREGDAGGLSAQPTKAGEFCRALKAYGMTGLNPSNPEFRALIERGVPLETFEAAAQTCRQATPPKGMGYMLAIVKRQLAEAAAIESSPGMPSKPWDDSRSTIEAKGEELGLGRWDEHDLSASRETFQQYTARVRRAVEARQGVPA